MRSILSTALLFFMADTAWCQPLAGREIDTLVERTRREFNVPGIAVAVIKDGKVIHSKGYGVRSLRTGKKVGENTLFGIASNSKAFTAGALGILVDEGKIKWDDKVRTYIPEFRMYDPFVTEEFTIRDLLTHRSGLGLGAGDLMLFPDSSDFTLKDVISNLQYLKPTSSFRTKFDYDNNLYVIAGEVLARVSGQSWDAFVEKRIFQPLGMAHSAGSYDRLKETTNVVDPHAPVDGKLQVVAREQLRIGHSAGGINSSIADLSKWVITLLSEGKYGDKKQLFSKTVLNEMWAPQTILPVRSPDPYNTHFAAYGLGFFISDVKGNKQLSHTGGLTGMVTQVTMIPEQGLGIIVLTNQQEGQAFNAITNQIKDSYLGLTGTDRVKEYGAKCKGQVDDAERVIDSVWRIVATNKEKSVVEPHFIQLEGIYKDPWFGDVIIGTRNGKMWFQSKRAFKISGELFFLNATTYIAKWTDRSMDADAYVTFDLDEKGNGRAIHMKPISPLTDFSYDFQDLEFKRE